MAKAMLNAIRTSQVRLEYETEGRKNRTMLSQLGRLMLSRHLVKEFLQWQPNFSYLRLVLWGLMYWLVTAIVPIGIYLIPMRRIEDGYYANWSFSYIVVPLVSFVGFFLPRQWFEANLRCRLNGPPVVAPLVGAGVSVLCNSLMGINGIFPVPFALVGVIVPGIIVTVSIEFFFIPAKHRNTFQKIKMVVLCVYMMAFMVLIALIYIGFRIIWLRLNGGAQAAFSIVLPVIKYALKYLCSLVMVHFRVDTVPCVGYFLETYNSVFYAVLFMNKPSVASYVILILSDWVTWFIYFWDLMGWSSRLKLLWHFDRYDYIEAESISPVVSTSALSLASSSSHAQSQIASGTDKDRSVVEAQIAEDEAADAADERAEVEWAAEQKAAALGALATPQGLEGASGDALGAEVAAEQVSVTDPLYRPPRERRRLYVAAFSFISLALQLVVPLQYVVYLVLAYNYADVYNFFFLSNIPCDPPSYELGIILNCVDFGSQLLSAAVFVPLIYRSARLDFFSFGFFYFKRHWRYFITAHYVVFISILGLSLKHYGDDFTFQFLWLPQNGAVYNSTLCVLT